MLERIIILVLILAGVFLLIKKGFYGSPKRIKNPVIDFTSINSGLPTILYFWTEQCTQCVSLQNPALSKLKKQNQFFNLVSYNALNEVKITKELNIKTVPSTVVLSQKNEIKFVNNGFASEKLLASQLKGI